MKIRIAALITPNNVKIAKELGRVAEIRNVENSIKARFAVIDNKDVMLMPMDDEKVHPNYDVGIWINTPFLAQALQNLFETGWQKFKPVK